MIACRDLDDDPLTAAGLDHLDLVGDAPRKSQNFRPQAQGGNILDRRFVLFGNRRHSRLDTVNSQRIELSRNRHLLLTPEDDRRLLLTIAQRNVVDLCPSRKGVVLPHLRQIIPRAYKPFVRFRRVLHVASETMDSR